MRQFITGLFFLSYSLTTFSQIDYTSEWEEMYSYNHVVDFTESSDRIIALTDNALFIYDKNTRETEKISSVNGLSGEVSSSLYYDENTGKIIIGYENGLVEVIDDNRKVTYKPDIMNFGIIGSKRINHITANGTNVLMATPFGIIVFDLNTNNFGDTYYIGDNSSEVNVYETRVFNHKIYAIADNGIYIADADEPFLVDSTKWTHLFTQSFDNICIFNDDIYVVSQGNQISKLIGDALLAPVMTQSYTIEDIRASDAYLTVSLSKHVKIYDRNLSFITQSVASTDTYNFTAKTAQIFDNILHIATKEYGILQSNLSDINNHTEIHPEGPLSNDVFSINYQNNNLWVVYGGWRGSMVPLYKRMGVSHYNGENWVNIPYAEGSIDKINLVHVTFDPFQENKVYISSFHQGMLVIEDDVVTERWDQNNSGLESLVDSHDPEYRSVRIDDTVFDDEGNLWITNSLVEKDLKKRSPDGQWSEYAINSGAGGMKGMLIDHSGNIWIGTRANGAIVVKKTGNPSLHLTKNEGVAHNNVRALAVDNNNTIWMGTREGLSVISSSASFFEQATHEAHPIVIASGEDDNFGIALLGTQRINAICVDGANNKWFGTDTGGVLYTNPSGKETFLYFDKANSPLPSNKILDIKFDDATGKVYFATDRGIVIYNSHIAPYGEHLGEVYAYPNPVTKNHDVVNIAGRNGSTIPYGTNIKIIDVAGNLVYETNIKEGQEPFGGKAVWDKTNLAGHKVASGVYIVLLTTKDANESSMTKIAIVN